MRAPRTGERKRSLRAAAIAAAKAYDLLEERYYYDADHLCESERRELYKQLHSAQIRCNAATLAYFLGANRVSVAARLKRRAARRKAAKVAA